MGKRIHNLDVRKEVNDKMNVEIRHLACYLTDKNDLYVLGAIIAKEGYKDKKGLDLVVKADIVDKDENILFTLKTWSNILLDYSGYDGFELRYCAIERVIDVSAIAGVRVYAVHKKSI